MEPKDNRFPKITTAHRTRYVRDAKKILENTLTTFVILDELYDQANGEPVDTLLEWHRLVRAVLWSIIEDLEVRFKEAKIHMTVKS